MLGKYCLQVPGEPFSEVFLCILICKDPCHYKAVAIVIRIYLLWLKPKLLIWDTFVNSHKLLSLNKVFHLSLAPLQSLIKIYFIQTDEVTQVKHYKESTEKTLKFWQAFFLKVIIKRNIVLFYEQSCPASLGWVDELPCLRWMIVISLCVFIKCWFSKIFLAVSTKITCVFWHDGKVFQKEKVKNFCKFASYKNHCCSRAELRDTFRRDRLFFGWVRHTFVIMWP